MKKTKTYISFTILLALCLSAVETNACLTFCLNFEKKIIYGRNFDWDIDVGSLFVNQRNIRKTAFVRPPAKPVSWISKYGSITFNQFSKDVPIGGMNEEGLVIESLVTNAEHSPLDKRKAINELQWIQYHLDSCRTIEEVIQSAKKVRISLYAVKLHYFISDYSGRSAVIEFIDGKLVTKTAENLPIKILANRNYDEELKSISSQKSRFTRASHMIEKYNGLQDPIEYSFTVLDEVSQGEYTKWQVVYNISQRQIYFRTLRNSKIKLVNLSDFNFDNIKETLMLDVNLNAEDSISEQFTKYTAQLNDEMINASLREFKKAKIMQHITPQDIAYIRKVIASYMPVEFNTSDI